MKIIVGLGNPGEKYAGTRHNLGFLVVDHFLRDFATVENTKWSEEPRFKSIVSEIRWQPKEAPEERVLLVMPQTFMNNSGEAVSLVSSFYKVSPEDIWIIHDELDLPLGTMKIRFGGAAAGHHGVENIIAALGTDKFWRFRLGIGRMNYATREMTEDGSAHPIGRVNMGNTEDYVLGAFTGKDAVEAKKLAKHASEALQVALEKGMEAAMNRFNSK